MLSSVNIYFKTIKDKAFKRKSPSARLVWSDESGSEIPSFRTGDSGVGDGPRSQVPDPKKIPVLPPQTQRMGCCNAGGDGATLDAVQNPHATTAVPVESREEINLSRLDKISGNGNSGEGCSFLDGPLAPLERKTATPVREGGESGELPCILAVDPLKLGLRTALLGCRHGARFLQQQQQRQRSDGRVMAVPFSSHNPIQDSQLFVSNKKGTLLRVRETKNKIYLDLGLIRTDAPEGTRFRVLRIRPLCHQAIGYECRRLIGRMATAARMPVARPLNKKTPVHNSSHHFHGIPLKGNPSSLE